MLSYLLWFLRVYEDGEQNEFQRPELEPEEGEEPSVTYSVQHKQIMQTLFKHFPNKFNVADQNYFTEAHRLFGYNASTPRFIIDPVMTKGSFLDTPVWQGEAATRGIWPLNTRFRIFVGVHSRIKCPLLASIEKPPRR